MVTNFKYRFPALFKTFFHQGIVPHSLADHSDRHHHEQENQTKQEGRHDIAQSVGYFLPGPGKWQQQGRQCHGNDHHRYGGKGIPDVFHEVCHQQQDENQRHPSVGMCFALERPVLISILCLYLILIDHTSIVQMFVDSIKGCKFTQYLIMSNDCSGKPMQMEKKKPSGYHIHKALVVVMAVMALLITRWSWMGGLDPLWVCVSSAAVFLLLFLRGRTFWRVVFFNLAAFFLILALFESYFVLKARWNPGPVVHTEGVYDHMRDEVTGARMVPGSSRRAIKTVDGALLYDVQITADTNGLRISPPCESDSACGILFFGDSFTFGEGVNDNETMPWRVGEALGNSYCIYNFALHGYGPHHMLALVEGGRVFPVVTHEVKDVIYEVLYPDHVFRLAGYFDWDVYGPWYELDDQGNPVRLGSFDTPGRLNAWTRWILRSQLGSKAMYYFRYDRTKDKERFVAVLLHTWELLQVQYPDARFHLLLWDWTEGQDDVYFDRLRDAGILIHDVETFIPNGDKSNPDLKISPFDKHPNAACQQLFADYVLAKIIQPCN